jgi:hypothetical protein
LLQCNSYLDLTIECTANADGDSVHMTFHEVVIFGPTLDLPIDERPKFDFDEGIWTRASNTTLTSTK